MTLLVDGADITAVIPRYTNRLIVPEAMDTLMSRKRVPLLVLCAAVGVQHKTMWRFRMRHRVLPIATGWRITTALRCRISDFTEQLPNARAQARINAIAWEARDLTAGEREELAGLIGAGRAA